MQVCIEGTGAWQAGSWRKNLEERKILIPWNSRQHLNWSKNGEESLMLWNTETLKEVGSGSSPCQCQSMSPANHLGSINNKPWSSIQSSPIEHVFPSQLNHCAPQLDSGWMKSHIVWFAIGGKWSAKQCACLHIFVCIHFKYFCFWLSLAVSSGLVDRKEPLSQAELERQQIIQEMKKKTPLLTDSSWIRQRTTPSNTSKEPVSLPMRRSVLVWNVHFWPKT